jgi:hypothetical protein
MLESFNRHRPPHSLLCMVVPRNPPLKYRVVPHLVGVTAWAASLELPHRAGYRSGSPEAVVAVTALAQQLPLLGLLSLYRAHLNARITQMELKMQ